MASVQKTRGSCLCARQELLRMHVPRLTLGVLELYARHCRELENNELRTLWM